MTRQEERILKVFDFMEVKEECPHCKQEITFKLTDFEYVNMTYGLVYKCPECGKEFYLADLVLEKKDD